MTENFTRCWEYVPFQAYTKPRLHKWDNWVFQLQLILVFASVCLLILEPFCDSSQYKLTMFRLRQLNYGGVLQQKGFYRFQARVGAFSNVVA